MNLGYHIIYLYPFLGKIDYQDMINKYDEAKLTLDDDKTDVIMIMYRISSDLTIRLKTTSYKINSTRKKKRKKN